MFRSNLKLNVWCHHQERTVLTPKAEMVPLPALIIIYGELIICQVLYGGLQSDDLRSSSQQPYDIRLTTFPILQRKEGLREVK